MAVNEFQLIQRYFQSSPCAQLKQEIDLGIGDDCALLTAAMDSEFAISTDTLVADSHFPAAADPFLIGQRALAVSASDLAAMGAKPIGFTLALTLPKNDDHWLKAFSEGLAKKAQQCDLVLIGGDTTKGALSMTLTVIGTLPKGKALLRSKAQVGDLLCISDYVGDAGGALPMVLGERLPQDNLMEKYWSPVPQLVLGQLLRTKATACLDISDGLVADCEHIAQNSQVKIIIDVASINPSADLAAVYTLAECRQFMLTGGDDYQLLFTLPPRYLAEIKTKQPSLQVIGRVETGCGVIVVDEAKQPIHLDKKGYLHF